MNGLMLHCGAEPLSRDQVAMIETPAPMGARHKPVAYSDFINLVSDSLHHIGLQITSESFGALKDGSRFFGLMDVASARSNSEYNYTVGLRASHDQSFARELAFGSHVFVCDNLAFSGDITIKNRQTLYMGNRLPGRILEAVETLPRQFEIQDERYNAYQSMELKPRWGDAALTECVRRGILNPSRIGHAIEQWDSPAHEEHEQHGRSVWRLMNAVTETLKAPLDDQGRPTRPGAPMQMQRTVKLTAFLDEIVGFDIAA